MSGGYFDRNIYAIGEIVASIERERELYDQNQRKSTRIIGLFT